MIGGKVITIGLDFTIDNLIAKSVKVEKVGDVMMIAARAVDNSLKKHFRKKNQEPNKKGWPKQNFWAQIRESVQTFRDGAESATVQVNDPRLNPHVFGATITPKEKKFLAVPLVAAAYGRRASTFTDLEFLPRRKKGGKIGGFLVKPGAEGAVEFYYVLLSEVTVKADPTALPDFADLEKDAGRAVELWITRQVAN